MEEMDIKMQEDVKAEGVEDQGEKTPQSTTTTSTAADTHTTTATTATMAEDGRPRLPVMPSASSIRTTSGMMTPSSTPLGHVNAARRPGPLPARGSQSSGLSQDIQEKMKAFSLSRQGAPANGNGPGMNMNKNPPAAQQGASNRLPGGVPPMSLSSPQAAGPWSSPSGQGPTGPIGRAPTPKIGGGLAAKRGMAGGMKLSNVTGPSPVEASPAVPNANGAPSTLPGGNSSSQSSSTPNSNPAASAFSKYSEFIDTKAGTINFKNKAVIHGKGIDFSSGQSFSISLDEVESLNELGKGNYGTVYRVRHCRPRLRRPGLGLKGTMAVGNLPDNVGNSNNNNSAEPAPVAKRDKNDLTNVIMAMKEIRLELDEAKFTAIIMELDILHRCLSPFIIDFYGAFFQEGAVYICVEYMDGGSMEKVYAGGVPENILRKITLSTVMGLKALKDEHNIIHRDVKPTNILVNTRGQIKICDFGVSGNLVASIAKTNIGCQSYMAPERIAGGGHPGSAGGGTYSVQSDIWSLGLTIVECAMGRYPYPPETYNNIFSQLNAIVQGDPPTLPAEGFSPEAKDFVSSCLQKNPALRPTYANLIRHAWVESLMQPPPTAATTDGADQQPNSDQDTYDEEVAAWVCDALERRRTGQANGRERPALHAVALDAVPKSPLLEGHS
ncbi:MAP kinase kinase Wis1 [Microsporum audouinii]